MQYNGRHVVGPRVGYTVVLCFNAGLACMLFLNDLRKLAGDRNSSLDHVTLNELLEVVVSQVPKTTMPQVNLLIYQ